MGRLAIWAAVLAGSLGLHCAGGDEELSPEQKRQQVREQGTYCCTHDGTASSGSCVARAGAVYLVDFEAVDGSGRGDACGWILNR